MPDDAIVLVIAERARRDGKYSAWHNGKSVVADVKEPFLDAARVLLAQGHDPATRYVMRRAADGPDQLGPTTLGVAAKLAVYDDAHGRPRFKRWVPFDRSAVE